MKKGLFLLPLFLLMGRAEAFVAFSASAEVSDIDPDVHVYNYTVTNKCFIGCFDTIDGQPVSEVLKITDFYVPLFSDANISDLASPTGWGVETVADDPFNLGTGTIHWQALTDAAAIVFDESLSGFSFTSTWDAAVKAPFQVLYANETSFMGDPPIPASPAALNAGLPLLNQTSSVPEAGPMSLLGLGLLGVLAFRRRA